MTTSFELPSAWRCEPAAGEPAQVSFTDLRPTLRASTGQTDLGVVLLAVHLKVLSMITDEDGPGTDVRGGDGVIRRLAVDRGVGTWTELVRRTGAALTTAPPADPRPSAGAVLFELAEASPGTGYGLRVVAADGILELYGHGGAIGGDHLDRLAAIYRSVLITMAGKPGTDASAACLPPAELDAVLHRWADGGTVNRGTATVVELIGAQALRTPGATAVRYAGSSLTYRDLDERGNRVAHHLSALGAGPGTLVGVCLRRGLDLLPTLLGIWKSGAGYLPLDPDLPVERLRGMLGRACCQLVVTDVEHRSRLTGTPHRRFVLLDEHRAAIAAAPATVPAVRVGPADLAYVIFTSGSTGQPKGVMVHHGGLANYLLWTAVEYAGRGDGGSPFFTPLSFDLGVPSLFTPLITGQAVDLLPDPLPIADLGDLLVAGAPYSFIKMTPGHLNLLSLDLTAEQAAGLAGVVIAAGDSFTADLAARWRELAGPDGTAVATEYGPTEITVGNSGEIITRPPGTELIPLGAPIPNTTMYVLTDDLQPVPTGVEGEIVIGGAGVAWGYLGDPALTADRFRPDPFGAPSARLYRTGDRGRWLPDGALEFLGRADHQVKVRGYRVELGEIRACLRDHPDVRDAVVLARDERGRAGGLVAFVVAAAGARADATRLREYLVLALPDYMVPAQYVVIDDIPLTVNGKVDPGALLRLL
ncbi:amino acid adenylation domain-containing protein [Actinoplanes sp. NPDC051346]|uniref:amino acid adenylation domain-containing protein n=1 Tax=Actinoplanes sp. NPDC051346 TaxID=3155048 RepID=UPI00343F598A